jgi:hypothetical protein
LCNTPEALSGLTEKQALYLYAMLDFIEQHQVPTILRCCAAIGIERTSGRVSASSGCAGSIAAASSRRSNSASATRKRTTSAPNAKQAALASTAEQIFYGGAVGGGKTVWLVVVAIMTCLMHPGVHVAIFRRHYKELAQNVIPQFLSLLPPRYGRFSQAAREVHVPERQRLLVRPLRARERRLLYQGNQWVKLLVDEASHMTQFIIGYLSTRVRSPRRDVFLQLLMGSNPGGPGHGFLKRGWVRPEGWEISHLARPAAARVWRPRPPKDRPNRYMPTRQFIPAYFARQLRAAGGDPFYLDRVIGAAGHRRRPRQREGRSSPRAIGTSTTA